MAKKKQLMILLRVLILLLVLYLGIGIYKDWKQGKESEASTDRKTVTRLEAEDIQQISYTDTERTVTFKKEDGTWYHTKDKAFPLKQSCAEDAAAAFAQITANRRLDQADALPDYGLDAPSYTVTLTDKEGAETVVKIGSQTADSDYYLTADEKTVFTGSSSLVESLIFDESTLLQTEPFPEIDSSNLKTISIKQKGKTLVQCSGEDEDLASYGSELSSVDLTDCVNYKVTTKDLASYGLDADTRKEVTAVYQDSQSKKEESQVFYMGTVFQEEESDYAYMQLKDSKMVYKVFVSATKKLIEE